MKQLHNGNHRDDFVNQRIPAWVTTLFSLCAITLIGLFRLPTAFHGDQALFQMGAQRILNGQRIYVDFWDGKSPGIYFFHAIAGKLFGWTEVGVHSLELIWQMAFAVIITFTLRPILRKRWLATFAAVLIVGGYYAVADEWHLTQPAALLMLPLYATGYCTLKSRPGQPDAARWAFIAGLCGSVAIIFKEECIPAIVATVVVATFPKREETPHWQREWLKATTLTLLGLVIGLGAFLVWIARHGSLGALLWTIFEFPIRARVEHRFFPLLRLASSWRWFMEMFWPSFIVGLALVLTWRSQTRRSLVLIAVASIVGGGTVLLEPFAWWPFDMLVVLPLVGVIVVTILDHYFTTLKVSVRYPRLAQFLVATAILAPGLYAWQGKARHTVSWLLGQETGDDFRKRTYMPHRCAAASSDFLKHPGAAPGPIYVVGDPNLARLGQREQSGRIHGWGWEILLPAQLDETVRALQMHPPPYLHVSTEYVTWMEKTLPEFGVWVASEYGYSRVDSMGSWHGRQSIPDLPSVECHSSLESVKQGS